MRLDASRAPFDYTALRAVFGPVRSDRDRLIAEVVHLGGPPVHRVWMALTLRFQTFRLKRRVMLQGVFAPRTFIAVPDLNAPVFLYELGTPAARYANRHLRLATGRRFRAIRHLVGVLMGCDPAAGAIVVAGLRK